MKRKVSALLIVVAMFISMMPAFAEQASAASPVISVTAVTHVEDLGQFVDSFTVKMADGFDGSTIDVDNLFIENNVIHPSFAWYSDGVENVKFINGFLIIKVDPFLFKKGFIVNCVKDSQVLFSFTKENVVSYSTDVVDDFDVVWTDEANYRIYKPDTDEKLPLIIWFHGAGECGNDTYLPLVDYRAALCWAEPAYQAKNPCIVLVPQIPAETTFDKVKLDDVRAMADKLIAEGIVDENRVYTVGFSAWQATLWFNTYNIDFVAGSIHCLYWHAFDPDPRTDEEWGGIGWDVIANANLPLWSVVADGDPTKGDIEMKVYHIPYMEANNPNFHYTIWSHADMAEYNLFDVGFILHWGWFPVVDNQEIIDWLFTQNLQSR